MPTGPETPAGNADDAFDIYRVRHVCGDRFDVARRDRVENTGCFVQVLLGARRDYDSHALPDKYLGDRAADTPAASRHNRDLALDFVLHQNIADPTPPSTVSVTPVR